MQVNINDKELMLLENGTNRKISEWTEEEIVVPDTKPDVMQIISVSVTPYVLSEEISDGRVKVEGKLNYFIIYKVSDEKFNSRGIFVSHPFTKTLNIDNLKKDSNVYIIPTVQNIITQLPNERKIIVKSEIVFNINTRNFANVKLISNFTSEKDIEKKMAKSTFSNIKACKKSIIASREDVLLDKECDDLFEILKIETQIDNTEIKESFNKIMLKGDILLNITYLTENKENSIKKTKAIVPFTGMVEFDNINDNSKFDIDYIIKDLEVNLNSDITTTKAISVSYKIESAITMYEREEVEYVDDFYSQYEELEYDKKEIEVVKDIKKITTTTEIKEFAQGVFDNQKLIDISNIDYSSINYEFSDGLVKLNGNIKISLLLQNIDTNEINAKNIEILVDKECKCDGVEQINNNDLKISILNSKIIQNDDNLEITVNLKLEIESNIFGKICTIENLNTKKLDNSSLDSMNIYIVKKDDNLWKVAKKYKTSVENIEKINDDLRDENISVGQKILIIR